MVSISNKVTSWTKFLMKHLNVELLQFEIQDQEDDEEKIITRWIKFLLKHLNVELLRLELSGQEKEEETRLRTRNLDYVTNKVDTFTG